MADNFQVLDAASSTVTFRSTDNGLGVEIMMSIPTNKLGTAMIGQAVMATSMSVVLPSDQIVSSNISQVGGTAVTLGQKISATSMPVVLPSDQIVSTNLSQVGGSTINLGQVTMASSIPVAISNNQAVFPVAAGGITNAIYNATTALTVNFTAVITSASGSTMVVASTNAKQIRVVALQLVSQSAVNVQWQSGTSGSVNITGAEAFAANGGYVLNYNPVGWFQTIVSESLWVSLSGTSLVGGSLTYINV